MTPRPEKIENPAAYIRSLEARARAQDAQIEQLIARLRLALEEQTAAQWRCRELLKVVDGVREMSDELRTEVER